MAGKCQRLGMALRSQGQGRSGSSSFYRPACSDVRKRVDAAVLPSRTATRRFYFDVPVCAALYSAARRGLGRQLLPAVLSLRNNAASRATMQQAARRGLAALLDLPGSGASRDSRVGVCVPNA